jgi:NAD+ synthase (glutamine-hydrolysing)
MEALLSGNRQVEQDVKRLAVYDKTLPNTPQQLCNQLFHTVYMGM